MKRWLVLLVAVAGCSEASPFAPEAFSRIPCEPPAKLVAMITGPAFAPVGMRSALVHAANRMTVALGTDPQVRSLKEATQGIAANIIASENDGACRMLSISADLLEGLPDTPATFPDRDGIRMILALTAHSLAAALEP